MNIWIPARLYNALPICCLALAALFFFGSGPVNVTLSLVLGGYALYVLAVRFWLSMMEEPKWE